MPYVQLYLLEDTAAVVPVATRAPRGGATGGDRRGLGMPVLGTPRLKIQVIDLARAIEGLQARANAMGAAPHAYARACGLSIALENHAY